MEHLFKLKEDGKTVGYLKIQGGILQGSIDGLDWHYITNQNPAGDLMLSNEQWVHFFDTAHPFVTKDKNGKDVFEGDKIKAGNWYFEVIWQKYGYGLKSEKSGWWRQFHEFEHIELAFEDEGIELIEDKRR